MAFLRWFRLRRAALARISAVLALLAIATHLEVWLSNQAAQDTSMRHPREGAARSSQAFCSSYPHPRACVFRDIYAFNGELHFVRFSDESQPSHAKTAHNESGDVFRLMPVNNQQDLADLTRDSNVHKNLGELVHKLRFTM